LPPETLADLLALGPLALGAGLRYAGEIAAELRDLHQGGRAYGQLTASSVLLTESGAHLSPLHRFWDEAMQERDVHAFGAVLYQMLTGKAAPATLTAAEIRVPGARTGPSHLRPAAMKLALKCLAATGTPLSMQQAATELRLLGLLLRQYEANTREGREAAPAAAPVLLRVTPPESVWKAPAGGGETGPVQKPSTGETGAAPLVPLGPDSFGHPKAKAQAEPQPAGGNCPKCDSTAVYVSRARSRFERMLERWEVPICRCHRCYHRYVVIARFKIGKDMPVGTERAFRPKRRHR
jgi:DNA-directed RNA polymerase subunit M/transcription elongation factor TFIIS